MPYVIVVKHTKKRFWINKIPIGTILDVDERYDDEDDWIAPLERNPIFRSVPGFDSSNGTFIGIPLDCVKPYTVIDIIRDRCLLLSS